MKRGKRVAEFYLEYAKRIIIKSVIKLLIKYSWIVSISKKI